MCVRRAVPRARRPNTSSLGAPLPRSLFCGRTAMDELAPMDGLAPLAAADRGRSPPLIHVPHRDGVPLAGSAARKAQDDLTAAIKLAPPQRCGRGTRCARAATMLLPARARARIHSLMHATLAPNLVLARLTALLRVYCRLHVLQARAIGIRCSTGACHRPPFGRVGDSRPGFRLSAQRPPPPPPPPLRRDEGR